MEPRLVLSTFNVPSVVTSGIVTIPTNPPGDDQYLLVGNWGPTYGYTFGLALPANDTITLANQGPSERGFYIDGVTSPDNTTPLDYAVLNDTGVSVTFQTTVAGTYRIDTDPGGWLDGAFTLAITVPPVSPQVTFTANGTAAPLSAVLMVQIDYHVDVTSNDSAPSSYGIQILGHGVSPANWTDLVTSPTPDFKATARLAGQFSVRAFAVIDGARQYSDQIGGETIQFPTIGEVAAEPAVVDATRAAWQDTLKYFATNHHLRREEGFWITLNTATGTYGHSAVVFQKPPIPGNSTAGGDSKDLLKNKPADTFDSRSLDATYVVASFHTHTPAMYVPRRKGLFRTAGPSKADDDASTRIGIPGLVYDYVGQGGKVLPGTPMKDPAKLYVSPYSLFDTTRRQLPGT